MIQYVKGNIFDSPAQTIVNPVNCKGVMGAGLAKQFKDDWRNTSEIKYIESGLRKFVQTYQAHGITSVAFPPLGCGLGGLDFSLVKLLFEKYLSSLPIDVYVYCI